MNETHEKIGLPLKPTYTDIENDPEVLKNLGMEKEENRCYNFLGLSWNLKTNTIMPTTYFNMVKKNRGISGNKKLMGMKKEDFEDKLFRVDITRRTMSRLCAQAYNRIGWMLGPIISGLKILVSKSTELTSAKELDKPLDKVDKGFVDICIKFLHGI